MRTNKRLNWLLAGLLAASSLACADAEASATIVIINKNAAGVGFNDPTPAAPVGGNSGVTLGAQRLIAFQHAADIWGAILTSVVPIRVAATFEPLACTADSAVLGSAGTRELFAQFPNAPRQNTWYPGALASKLAGVDQASPGEAHIQARFNSRLGLFPDCLPGTPFYLGLDNAHGTQVDLVTVLLHELAHGLGFQSFTDGQSGEQIENRPAMWDYLLVDSRSGKNWAELGVEERRLSAIGINQLVWNGPRVKAAVVSVLAPQTILGVAGPAAGSGAGAYDVGDAAFGPPVGAPTVSAELMPVVDQSDGSGFACGALNAANALAVFGNIALVDRGGCPFTVKAINLQNAGARAMVVADNVAGQPAATLGGGDAAVTIPSVRVTYETGLVLKAALKPRTGTTSGVIATLGVDTTRLAGADRSQRIRMNTPTEYAPGSSVSHYTIDARANQLMEPAINSDLSHQVTPPRDLTWLLLQDIGW